MNTYAEVFDLFRWYEDLVKRDLCKVAMDGHLDETSIIVTITREDGSHVQGWSPSLLGALREAKRIFMVPHTNR